MNLLAIENNIPFIDLLPDLQRNLDIDSAYLMEFVPTSFVSKRLDQYTGNNHMSAYGYRVIADVIAQHILTNNMHLNVAK